MQLKRFCQREVAVATPRDTVVDAARRMRDAHVGDLVVVEERDGRRWPVGMVTDRDLVIGVVAEATQDLHALCVSEVMVTPVVVLSEDHDVTDALRTMRRMSVRRLPLTALDGSLVGIVTLDDIVDILSATLREATSVVGRQQAVERAIRKPRAKPPAMNVTVAA